MNYMLKKTILGGLAAAVAAVGIAFAAPASATTSEYLAKLQEQVPYVLSEYGSTAMVNEGYKVCQWSSQGLDDMTIVDNIKSDMPMSTHAAIWVHVLANSRLGC